MRYLTLHKITNKALKVKLINRIRYYYSEGNKM